MANRNANGNILSLVAVTAFVMVLIGLAVFQVILAVGASREVRGSVNAGTLNVAKKAVEVTVTPDGAVESQFDDITDDQGRIGLRNVNRMWGKAMLVALNAQAMTGGQGHAEAIYSAAKSMNDRLAKKLNDEDNLHGYFNEISRANSSRMVSADSAVKEQAGRGWQTSFVDRGLETNVEFDAQQLPQGGDAVSAVAIGNSRYIAGYEPITVGGKPFVFVPFQFRQQPHLISADTFSANRREITNFSTPVPNAFSTNGAANNSNAAIAAMAYAVANPERSYKLAIPHGFIRIKLGQHKASITANADSSEVDYTPGLPQTIVKSTAAGSGTLTTVNVIGLDYVPPTLYQAIYGLPGNHGRVTSILLQRIREISPGFGASELDRVLASAAIVPGITEYYIYPIYKQGNENPTMVAGTFAQAIASAPWLNSQARAEGAEENVANEVSVGGPDVLIPILAGAGIPVYGPQLVYQTGNQIWKAGTGFDGCLGELRIERNATIISTGQVITP